MKHSRVISCKRNLRFGIIIPIFALLQVAWADTVSYSSNNEIVSVIGEKSAYNVPKREFEQEFGAASIGRQVVLGANFDRYRVYQEDQTNQPELAEATHKIHYYGGITYEQNGNVFSLYGNSARQPSSVMDHWDVSQKELAPETVIGKESETTVVRGKVLAGLTENVVAVDEGGQLSYWSTANGSQNLAGGNQNLNCFSNTELLWRANNR